MYHIWFAKAPLLCPIKLRLIHFTRRTPLATASLLANATPYIPAPEQPGVRLLLWIYAIALMYHIYFAEPLLPV